MDHGAPKATVHSLLLTPNKTETPLITQEQTFCPSKYHSVAKFPQNLLISYHLHKKYAYIVGLFDKPLIND